MTDGDDDLTWFEWTIGITLLIVLAPVWIPICIVQEFINRFKKGHDNE